MKNLLKKITLHALLISMAMPGTSTILAIEPNKPAKIESIHVQYDGKGYTINAADKEKLDKEQTNMKATTFLSNIFLHMIIIQGSSMIGAAMGDFADKKIGSKPCIANNGPGNVIGWLIGAVLGWYLAYADDPKKAMHKSLEEKQKAYFASIQNNKK